MYGAISHQEQASKDLFYPRETMGTTVMALKYQGGVIACADSSTTHST
jgi:20S proteasome alpha/beta subunit